MMAATLELVPMVDDKSPLDEREIKAMAQMLRSVVFQNLKPLGPTGGGEAAERAAELLEWQHDYIAELEILVRAFDQAGLRAQPNAGESVLETSNNVWFSSYHFAISQEAIRKTIEKVRARSKIGIS